MVEAYLGDEMAESMEHKEQLHREAMEGYKRREAERKAQREAEDARVTAYHAKLDEADAASRERDRAEYAKLFYRAAE